MNIKLLEKYENKVKVSINGVIQWLTTEEWNKLIDDHNNKILEIKKWSYEQSKLDKYKILFEIEKLKQNGKWEKILNEWKSNKTKF